MADDALSGVDTVSDSPYGPPTLSPAGIFWRFLQFGLMAWGGPVAQIGMLRRDLVDEERWITGARFNRLLAVFQVLPGPEAHELCVYFGTLPGGRLGGVLAGLAFMLPGFVLMLTLSWLYFNVDLVASGLTPIFLGMQPAVIALIVRAVHRIGAHVLNDRWLWAIGVVSTAATLAGTTFWLTLPAGGAIYALERRGRHRAAGLVAGAAIVGGLVWRAWDPASSPEVLHAGMPDQPDANASLATVFLSGLKAGLLTFGGAYTVIPFLRDDAVGNGWMSEAQFLDGLALSGILPAPLIIFSTFVGYVAAGPAGALLMTIGIFLPAFYFALFLHQHLDRLVNDPRCHAFLEGVSAAVVGLIAATALELAVSAAVGLPAILPGVVIFTVSLSLLYAWTVRTNVVFVVFGAGAAGWLLF